MIIAVAGGFLRTFGDSFILQLVSMFMLGAGISALNANLVKIFSAWFMDKTQVAMGFFFGSAGVGVILGCGVDPVTAGLIASCAAFGSIIGSLIGPAICNRLGKWKPYLIVTIIIGTLLMVYFWYGVIMSGTIPSLPFLMVVMVLSGAFGAINGPIVQAMPYALPDIRGKYAGSAGGLVSTIGLLCSYFIPVAVSAIAVGSYVLNLGIESVIFLASAVFILLIPELGPKGKVAKEIAEKEKNPESPVKISDDPDAPINEKLENL